MLEDFTTGEYSTVVTGNGNASYVRAGLDRAHSAWGTRQATLSVFGNPGGVPVSWDVGGGRDQVSGSGRYGTFEVTELGWERNTEVDLSFFTDIFVDLYSNPKNRIANTWSIGFLDANGKGVNNSLPGGRLLGEDLIGIRFRRFEFTGDAGFDWTRVVYMSWIQDWDADRGSPTHGTSAIYAVPEPTTLLGVAVASLLFAKRRLATAKGATRRDP